ncbi:MULTISPECIES: CYTH and CHAD domain-containing protein [unclassified Streptomyces]|uniref:CYTH and CHAD domain-containing protein n=1 Tax=unclassified Streptomyces TaxID=2593676 RepID=UPI000B8139C0|nr:MULTISPECIES: CYTH and CHAD domain-containing protein [unclassified Streptomyces]MYZ37601.1 CHAD domain-containing protein [Streptomyces sp. SID4917]
MAETKREIERKYELPSRSRDGGVPGLPDLARAKGVDAVRADGVVELDAVYYDTADLRLAAGSLTLRRRTGGDDAGWHLKLPVSPGVRDEIRAPLADTVPEELTALLRSRIRDARLIPVVRLRTSRDISRLLGGDGAPLAEVSVDTVRAQRLGDTVVATSWTEVEVELTDDADPALLDAVDKKLRKAGLRPASAASKLSRALTETARAGTGKGAQGAKDEGAGKPVGKGVVGKGVKGAKAKRAKGKGAKTPVTAAEHVLAYLRVQADAIVAQDPAVRRDLPDSVHQLRVATRRMRSAFRTYGKVVDRSLTDPIGEELKWLAAELGIDRDQEVLNERLLSRIAELPGTLLLGPVRARLRIWNAGRRAGSRSQAVAVLDSERYLALLDSLDALLADPPLLRPAAANRPGKVLPAAILKDYRRLAGRVEQALELPPGEDRDIALHNARKAAKRARYAAEAALPALGRPAQRFIKRMKAVQTVLGDHQDSVVARDALRDLGIRAHAAGESAFTWGLLHGHEEAQAAARERELPQVWERASAPGLRADLTG